MAEAVGTFDEYEPNHEPFMNVMQMHRDAVEEIKPECPATWSTRPATCGTRYCPPASVHGFRNAQATVLAPTGTISFMMDCDTTGIEPDIALVKYKQLAGGGYAEDRQPDGAAGAGNAGLRSAADRIDSRAYIDSTTRSRVPRGSSDEHLAGVRLCAFTSSQRLAEHRLEGSCHDDGGRPAVPLGSDLQDGQHAARNHARGNRRGVRRRLEARPQGAGHLPRRLEGQPAAEHQAPKPIRPRTRPERKLPWLASHVAIATCPTHGSRSPTSSASAATRATSPSACSKMVVLASCSSRWPKKAARLAA